MEAARVRLIRPSALQMGVDTPCVLEVNIPITLPHRLDPSLPAPPYYNQNDALPAEDFRDFHAMPLARALMAQIASLMFGPEYPGTILEADTPRAPATSESGDLQLLTAWECNAITDKENGFDFAAGYWKDTHGAEGHSAIHAYKDVFDRIEVYHAFKFYLVRGIQEPDRLREINPRVVRFDVVEASGEELVGSDREVVFEVKEYSEAMRSRYVNIMVAWGMAVCT